VRIATENLLADFLHEIRDVTYVARHLDERESLRKQQGDSLSRSDTVDLRGPSTSDSYYGPVLEAADSPFEANGNSDDEEGKSPVRDEKGTGGIVFLYFTRILSLNLRNGSAYSRTRCTHQLRGNH
jgi:vacuole morphology and inheritance protein 14